MPRHRQVRLGYPQTFIELALLLAVRQGRRHAARIMAVPLSTIYRWFDQYRRNRHLAGVERGDAQWLEERLADCEAHGFDLRQRFASIAARAAAPASTPDGHPLPMSATAPSRPAATHERVSRRHAVVAALSPAIRTRVERARAEIDRYYYAHLSCERLAGIAGMSRFHFIRTFKSAFTTAPYHYLMQVRIRHARELLSTTAQPLDAVAHAVGFDSQSSLCKAFRSVEGVSLSSYFHGMRLGSQMPRMDSHT
jgi:AraC-like DNA-binding protein